MRLPACFPRAAVGARTGKARLQAEGGPVVPRFPNPIPPVARGGQSEVAMKRNICAKSGRVFLKFFEGFP